MRIVDVTAPGGPEQLALREQPDPRPGPGEVVVQVVSAGVNRADLMQRQGHYPSPPGAPAWPGLEVSGRVLEVGPDVTGWTVGQEVCALLAGGGYAERVAVPVGQLLPVPAGVDLVDAAALPEVACTVWSNVVMVAGLTAGQRLLVHGGGSGIGTMAIQVGVALGARVAVTAGSAAKLAACAALGADVLVDYHEDDFVARVLEAEDGRGADVVLDVVGGDYLARNVEVLAHDGHLVVIGTQQGRRGELDLGALMSRRASVTGTTLRARPAASKAAIVAAVREHLWPLVEAGRVRPVVHARIPLAEAARAHRVLEESSHIGKVLLTTDAA